MLNQQATQEPMREIILNPSLPSWASHGDLALPCGRHELCPGHHCRSTTRTVSSLFLVSG